MNWHVFEYAGPTALAWAALLTSAAVALAIAAICGWLVWMGLRKGASLRKRIACLGAPVVCIVAYLAAWLWAGPHLDHAWLYLQQDAGRKSSTYAALTFATAFLPPLGDTGRDAFVHLATRDAGFAKGKPVSVEKTDGREIARYVDED